MAKFHYDLTGAEPIVRDVAVYDASTLVKGEFVIKDAVNDDDNHRFTSTTVGTDLEDALGIMNETLVVASLADYGDFVTTAATATTAKISSVAASGATTSYVGGGRYGKVIINPFAVYLTEYCQTADLDLTEAWDSTTLTIASLEDSWDGGWVLGSSSSTTTGFAGQLRHVSEASSGACTVVAPTVDGTTSDAVVRIVPVNKIVVNITTDGTKIESQAAVASESAATIVENYITAADRPLEPLKAGAHVYGGSTVAAALDLGSSAKAYSDLLLGDHLYNPMG